MDTKIAVFDASLTDRVIEQYHHLYGNIYTDITPYTEFKDRVETLYTNELKKLTPDEVLQQAVSWATQISMSAVYCHI